MPVQIHGKPYNTVAERLALVHQANKSFEVVDSSPIQCGNHWVWRTHITLDGKQYIGSAQVHLDARPGSADATDPFACAETSAVGRALAFAGILSSESIASADEMAGTTNSSGEYQKATSRPLQSQQETSAKKTRKEIIDTYTAGKKAGLWKSSSEFYAAASIVIGLSVNEQNVNTLSDQSLVELLEWKVA